MFIKFDNAIIRAQSIVSAFTGRLHQESKWKLYIETKDGTLYEGGWFLSKENANLALKRLFEAITNGTNTDMCAVCDELSEPLSVGARYNLEHLREG